MKVNIGPYRTWIGPYQIAEKILFWMDKYEDDRVHKFGDFLAGKDEKPSLLAKFCQWFYSKLQRKVKIYIDDYDVWNMDDTIAMIILPMLVKLKQNKHGSGFIELEDVPEHLRYTETEEYDAQYTFDFYKEKNDVLKVDIHTRYEWFLDELIWTFEQYTYDWEDQYWKQKDNTLFGLDFVDPVGYTKHQERIENGLRLFGKYYRTLWD